MSTSLWLAVLAAEGPPPSPLTVNGGLVVWTLVVFALLLFLLRKSAWPVLLGAVRERERRLEEQIAAAEKARAEARELLEQHKALLGGAKGEAIEILAKARAAAEKEREAQLAKARLEVEALMARARNEIKNERDRAVQELRREAVDLSLAAAAKLIETKLDSDANRRLVTDYLATLGQEK